MKHPKIMVALWAMLIAFTPFTVQAASDNQVNYQPRVRVDHVFTLADAPVLTIEEKREGDFASEEVVRLVLEKGEWHNPALISQSIQSSGRSAGHRVTSLGAGILQITFLLEEVGGGAAAYQIPLLTEMVDGGYATVVIQPRTGGVTAETIPFAQVVGARQGEVKVEVRRQEDYLTSLEPGEEVGPSKGLFVAWVETTPNALGVVPVTFTATLKGAQWIDRPAMNARTMQSHAHLQEAQGLGIERIVTQGTQSLDITLARDGFQQQAGSLLLPLYFQVTGEPDERVSLEVNIKDRGGAGHALILGEIVAAASVEETPENHQQEAVSETVEKQLLAQLFLNQKGYVAKGQWHESAFPLTVRSLSEDDDPHLLIPLSTFAQVIGAESLSYQPETREAYVERTGTQMKFTTDTSQMHVNQAPISLPYPVQIIEHRMAIPLIPVIQELQIPYHWDESQGIISLYQ